MKKNIQIITTIILSSILFCTAFAQDESFNNYDHIIDELTTNRSSSTYSYSDDLFADILLHLGVGMAMSMTNFKSANHNKTGLFRGIEINFGIDLFSKIWTAEGTYRNLGNSKIKNGEYLDLASLSEFDLKLVYRPRITRRLKFKSSFGLAARYLEYYHSQSNQKLNYTTPAWMMSLGFESKLTKVFSSTVELGYRSSMIEDTIDNSSVAAGIRLDANF